MSLIFDIETCGLSREEILATAPPFNRDEVKLGNRKTPESIMAYMENAEADYYDKLVERAALDARTGTVLCIGLSNPQSKELEILDGGEHGILTNFWSYWNGHQSKFLGFNILRFDLPFMVRRSWHVGVPVPSDVWDGRYFNRRFVDLMSYWSCGNRDEMISLDHLARFLDLPGKNGTGKGFAELWANDRPAAIEYLQKDLELTTQIARRMMLL